MRLRDFYELIVERHRQASTIITSNGGTGDFDRDGRPSAGPKRHDRLQSAAYELVVEGEAVGNAKNPQSLTHPELTNAAAAPA
jgi:hypothetical protein